MPANEGPLPFYLMGVLGLVGIGIVFVVPFLRGRHVKVVCPRCELSYRGPGARCPIARKVHVLGAGRFAFERKICVICGSSQLIERLWPQLD